MSRLTLVRHGEAAAGWGADHDPGLSEAGRRQAARMAATLAPRGPMTLVASPLRRTRETAAMLEEAWGIAAEVDPAVGEIASPTADLAERTTWLAAVMASSWDELGDPLKRWRDGVLEALTRLEGDTVVVTHFVAINVAVGAATGDDRVVCFAPDNCSLTTLDVRPGGLELVELGGEARTVVR